VPQSLKVHLGYARGDVIENSFASNAQVSGIIGQLSCTTKGHFFGTFSGFQTGKI
jgi:hypothetical protein